MLVSVGLIQNAGPGHILPGDGGTLESALSAFAALDGIEEVAVLSTCRRVEVYATARCPAAATLSLRRAFEARGGPELPFVERHGADAFRGLVRAAASLDAARAGEPGMLERVGEAFRRAVETGTAGRGLAAVAGRALQAARRVGAEAAIDLEGVSWGHAVTALAEKVLGPLRGRRALVVGTSALACLAVRHLARAGASVAVVDGGLAGAGEVDGAAPAPGALDAELARADVVVAAAPVAPAALGLAALEAALRARPRRIVVADLAAPRAVPVEAGRMDDVYLCDAHDLERVLEAALEERAWAMLDAERIVEDEVARWRRDDEERRAAPSGGLERAPGAGADEQAHVAARALAPAGDRRARPGGAA